MKKALLFFVDVANTECSSNWTEDMEKDCKKEETRMSFSFYIYKLLSPFSVILTM